MKYLFLFTTVFLLFTTPAFAEIHEGNASSDVDVHTSIDGSGSVSTHVETNVNGHTQNFDSTQPGDYHIQNNGKTSSVTNDATGTTLSPSPMASSSPSPIKGDEHPHRAPQLQNLWNNIQSFFNSLFHVLQAK